MKTWFLGVLLVILVLILAILWPHIQIFAPSAAAPSSPQIVVATSTITASTSEYTVDSNYPQFGIPAIDTQIKTWVQNGIDDLESQANNDQPAENNFPLYSFTSQFSRAYVGDDYISVELVLSDYTGGAHELPVIVGATFNRSTGLPVTLDEALALTGKTLEQVAQEAKAQLAQDPDTQPTDMWSSGSDPVPNNYQTFLVTADSVIFIFQPYQVAPYSAGAPEISISRIK